jgi:DNA-binding transcriptional LysR family regulator
LASIPPMTAPDGFSPLRIDLTELETFVAVVELGSFSQAAKRLHVSQPSVTARVQRLEERLRTPLLRRTTRTVEPTKDGVRLYEKSTQALRDLKVLVTEFLATADRGGHRVVVAATPMIAATTLPRLIHAYRQRYPDVLVKLLDLQYRDVVDQVRSGVADLAVIAFDGDSAKLGFQMLADEALLLVVPAKHPLARLDEVTLDQLVQFPLMILDRYTNLRSKIEEECRQRGLRIKSMTEATQLSTLLGMIDAGNGVTFLPKSMAQVNAKHSRATLQVTDLQLTRQYGIVIPNKGELSSAAQSFVRYLHQEYAATLAHGDLLA